jgi:hypothetical protein
LAGCYEIVTTLALALASVIHKYVSPVLPQIRLSGCYDFITTCISLFAAMLHGCVCVKLGTHAGQGRNEVHFDKFPQGGNKSAAREVFLRGHRADRKPAVKLSPRKPQLRGAFALQAKSLAYDRRRFDRTTAWAFNKKCNGRATRSKPCNSRDGNAAGDARRIATLPGAAARAPIKKD